jgi:hypothetical protein
MRCAVQELQRYAIGFSLKGTPQQSLHPVTSPICGQKKSAHWDQLMWVDYIPHRKERNAHRLDLDGVAECAAAHPKVVNLNGI